MATTSTQTIARIAARLAAGAFLVVAAVGSANAGGCTKFICGDNGTRIDGIRLEDLQQPASRTPADCVAVGWYDIVGPSVGYSSPRRRP